MEMESGPYDHLIHAEREALGRSGGRVAKVQLIKALREATDLDRRGARRAVERYLSHRGVAASTWPGADRPAGWIDDLLDAERASASKEERTVTKALLIKVLREASGLGWKPARDAVNNYLKRRGGEGLPSGSSGRLFAGIILIALVILGTYYWLR